MDTGKVILAGVVVFGIGYLIFRSRNSADPSSKEPRESIADKSAPQSNSLRIENHPSLERVIKAYQLDALHYRLFNWRNRKKICLAAEDALFAKYPKVLGEPVLRLPEELVLNPEIVSNWLANHGKIVGEYEYVGRALADYLLAEANKEAEIIVQKFVELNCDTGK